MRIKKKVEKNNKIRSPEFSKRVRDIRKHLKLNQQGMAEKSNISLPTLSDIENGRSYPCYDFFYNMVEYFNVNLYYILFGLGEMFDLPGKDVQVKDSDPIEKELRLILARAGLREFFQHFFGSRMLQYHMLSEYYGFMLKKVKDIEMEIEANEKEKAND